MSQIVEHVNLTGAQLHEPKGVASATQGTYYVSDGAGSGAWETLQEQTRVTSQTSEVVFTNLGDYSIIRFEIADFKYSSDQDIRVYPGVGGSYPSDNFRGFYKQHGTETFNLSNINYAIIQSDNTSGSTLYQTVVGQITNWNIDRPSVISWNGISSSDATHTGTSYGGFGFWRTGDATAYDTLRFKLSAGTYQSYANSFRVWGIKG